MVKAVALSTVHVCREPGARNEQGRVVRKAAVETVPPGRIFEVDQAQLDDFEAGGHARKAGRSDLAAADDAGQIPFDPGVPVKTSLDKPKK